MSKTKRAAGYIRVSSKIQVKGQSLKEQRQKIQKYCKTDKYELTEIFEDRGRAGDAEIADRPGLRDMIHAAESGDFEILLITRWDRFSRELLQTLIVEQQLQKNGVEIIAVEQDTGGLDTETAEFIRNILAATSQFEKALSIKKMANGKKQKFKDGIGPCSGPAAYGYKYDGPRGNRRLVPVPEEQEVLKLIKKLRRKGWGDRKIAGALNGDRLLEGKDVSAPTRRGGKWYPQTVTNARTSNHVKGKVSHGGKVRKIKKQ